MSSIPEVIRSPYRNFRFMVEIDGAHKAYFSEVSGFDLDVDVIEYRAGGEKRTTVHKFPGLTKFANITFRWGCTGDMEFLDWILSVASSDVEGPKGIARKNMRVTINTETNLAGPSWTIVNAWPSHYSIPDLNAMGSEIALESIELVHEGFLRVPPEAMDKAKDSGAIPGAGEKK